jgi:hypothetical protein
MNASIETLQLRLQALEDEKRVRQCMNQYMQLCDILDAGFELDQLMVLFTEDAIWEGKGSRYAETFGSYKGRDAIQDMFAKYTKPPAHFALNVHFLANELIHVDGDSAQGSWVLLQPSYFSSGKSQLSCARISAGFKRSESDSEQWQMSHFQTENLFSRPMDDPWDHSAPLPVPE